MVFLRQILHNNRQKEERMKKFLITTVLGIATTAAFGAASLRAPQIGGTATVATPTATNTARAGTMRTQTMKTSSVSAPSVTTTQSIATPISTETTDARIALLKGIKGFNPGKIKDTTAAQQELNAIDSRIEELQSKLDRAETAADQTAKLTDVYTKDQVEAKIDEKLSQLGTSTGTNETYSKTEINNLLAALERKLPQIDDRGNINITGANGNLIALLPYYVSSDYPYGGSLGQITEYTLHTPHDFGTTNWYPNLAQEYTNGWIGNICAPYQSDPDFLACGFWTANGTSTAMKDFYVARCFKGFFLAGMNHPNGIESDKYFTYENLTEEEIHEHFCGNTPNYSCWISDFEIRSRGPCKLKIFYVNMSNETPDYYFNYTGGAHGIAMGGNALTYLQHFATNAPLDSNAIDDFVDSYCGDREPFWCAKNGVIDSPSGFDDVVKIKERFHGYVLSSIEMSSVGTYSTYNTNEDEPATYINSNVCGNPNGTTSCYVVNVDDISLNIPYLLDPTSINIDDRYKVTVFKATTPETELPAPLQD